MLVACGNSQIYSANVSDGPSPFWRTQPGLVWSNPQANDSVHIRGALLRPRFTQLLEIAEEFSLERVKTEWAVLAEEGTAETQRAAPIVRRILAHIEQGFALAAS